MIRENNLRSKTILLFQNFKTQVSKQEELGTRSLYCSVLQLPKKLVATQQVSQELEGTWNNLYAGFIKGDASNLYSRRSKGLSVGVLLMVVKSKIYVVNSCIKT